MMWPLSSTAQTALVESHGIKARATIFSPDLGILPLEISGGTVTVDATSQVRRTATILADPRLWPQSPRDLLAPYGSACLVEYGIALRSGDIEWVPLIYGMLDRTERKRPYSGTVVTTVDLVDRSARVAEDRFDSPTQTVSGATVVTEIRRLIQQSLGTSVPVVDRTGSAQVAPVIEIERERWKDGVEKLADSIGAEVFADPTGAFVIRPTPTLTDPEVWQVSTGRAGTILQATDTLSRENVYNRVIASGQRSDGTPPVYAVVSDMDETSPTYYGGPFGKKPRFYSSGLLTTVPQCEAAAAGLLARVKGAGVNIAFDTLVNPALDAGDLIVCVDGTTVTRHLLDKVTIPLEPSGTQTLEARSLDLPSEQ